MKTKNRFISLVPSGFAILMIFIGAVDLTRPADLRAAMDGLSMPHYLLWILGFAKVLGGIVLIAAPYKILKEWAFSGFFIWAFGGIAAHVFSKHGVIDVAPLMGITVLLGISYFIYKKLPTS